MDTVQRPNGDRAPRLDDYLTDEQMDRLARLLVRLAVAASERRAAKQAAGGES